MNIILYEATMVWGRANNVHAVSLYTLNHIVWQAKFNRSTSHLIASLTWPCLHYMIMYSCHFFFKKSPHLKFIIFFFFEFSLCYTGCHCSSHHGRCMGELCFLQLIQHDLVCCMQHFCHRLSFLIMQ